MLLGIAGRMTARELRLRSAIGELAADVDREEHLDAVRRLLRDRGV